MPGTVAVTSLMVLTMYSGFLISRLVTAVNGCVLFSDIGEAAAGTKVRLPFADQHVLEWLLLELCSSFDLFKHERLLEDRQAHKCSKMDRRGCSQGRWLVQGIVHSFGATRCIILHLVTSQSLQHAAGNAEVPLVVYSLVIAVVALFCIQVSYLPEHFHGKS